MDLRTNAAAPTDLERAAVAEVLGPEQPRDGSLRVAGGGRAARERRALLLPTLHALQRRVGWISPGGLNHVAERVPVPPAEVYGVATFYSLFSTQPRARTVIHACDDVGCIPQGAARLCDDLERALGPEGEGSEVTWHRSPCLGACERAPVAFVQRSGPDAVDDVLAPTTASALLSSARVAPQTAEAQSRASLRLLARVGLHDPSSLDAYRAAGGYEALARALAIGPEGVIAELRAARLLGRGGAAFPIDVKWEAVRTAGRTPHHVVCNADESEPGTFKDRVLLEHDPFAIVEALTIAGLATGSERGYIYLRGEYPHAEERVRTAIRAARSAGLLGPEVAGSGLTFDIELRRGAGAYICGEETALFRSIEGHRGEPQSKPPFPVERGLFGRPTAVNNVETLANVPVVLRLGGAAYASLGTEGSTGTRLFCLSGSVARPGVYEVACGTSLRELLDLAGGIRGGGRLRAVLLGGASGSFVGPDHLDLPLSFEGARAAGLTLGSGVVMAFDDTVDLSAVIRRIARFFRDESCGQCVPCRIGTLRQQELVERLSLEPAERPRTLTLLDDVGAVMRDASICGLGQTASSAIASAIELGLVEGVAR